MPDATQLITDHLDTWTSTVVAQKTTGRGSSKKQELYGIKKLRELILDLAVRGLLVPQDPEDEPAEVLLNRIESTKADLIQQKKIKKTKPLSKVLSEDEPFLKPNGWEFVRIGSLTSKLGSGSTPRGGKSAYVDSGVIFLRSQNIWNDGLKLNDTAYIPAEIHENMSNTQVQPNDVLLNITGASLGRSTIFPTELETANVSQHVTIIRLIETRMARFLHLGILSPLVQKLVWGRQVGMAIEGLSKKVLEQFEFPIPPLAEQQRIVAKVDELMALCDRLEQQQEDSIRTHETLVKTLLDALTTTSDAAQFQQAWQRIQAHFHLLFTTKSSIDHLKQTTLQLAVTGKLVPQVPNEDSRCCFPAWKKHESKDECLDHPTQWMSVPLGKLGEWRGGGTPSKGNTKFWDGEIPWVCPKDMKRPIIHKSIDQITAEAIDKSSAKLIPKNSLLMVVRGMILAHSFPVARSGREVTINQDMKALLPDYHDTATYLHLALRALRDQFLNTVERSSHGTCKLLTKDLQGMLIPIPPLAEQHRIVAKVDELMALCDELKASLATAQATQRKLTDTMVEKAVN
ncbi:restriction endonuclease subunit S [Verrucomicrobiaceae bacterium 5K15]|uniref:Restriction endonuclease subunit S n=1 Tax=Oceaniferula flava TaxID=2800421 RepID=A0AAE2SA66_9BACT|nr:restriction endonuclease subunit S [Oceaniferula flavus]MBK1853804.1 restriction endonuclease subunit S [Oceaniferula flavus]MBM1135110.1 restriction endonuclease subunit S [Oceaniferula flavus]